MRSLLLLLTLLLGLLPSGSRADDGPCLAFLIPYRTVCDEVSGKVRVQVYVKKEAASPVIGQGMNQQTVSSFQASGGGTYNPSGATILIQEIVPCSEVDDSVTGDKLKGYPFFTLEPIEGTFTFTDTTNKDGSIKFYFLNVPCNEKPGSIFGDPDTLQWIDLDNNGTVLTNTQLSGDSWIVGLINNPLTIQTKLIKIAKDNGHGEPCCLSLIIPYRVHCARQDDGSDITKFQVVSHRFLQDLKLGTLTISSFLQEGATTSVVGKSKFLQAKKSCGDVQIVDGKLFGYPATSFGPIEGKFTFIDTSTRCGRIQVYLLDLGCGISVSHEVFNQDAENFEDVKWQDYTSITADSYLSLEEGVTLGVTLGSFATAASDGAKCSDCLSLLVPYRVVCGDGDKIKVQILVDTSHDLKNLVSNQNVLSFISATPAQTMSGQTRLLQSNQLCSDAVTTLTHLGFPFTKLGPVSGEFLFQGTPNNCREDGDLQVFLMDVGFGLLNANAFATANTTSAAAAWVDLDNNGTVLTNFASDPFVANLIFKGEPQVILQSELIAIANGYNHGVSCATNPFGFGEEYYNAQLCALLAALKGCPQDFTADGTFGSCGDTGKVTVKGTFDRKMTVKICGKTYCLTSVPSVASKNPFFTGEAGKDIVPCLAQFLIQYFNYAFAHLDPVANKFVACGYPSELEALVAGRPFKVTVGNVTLTLHLRKVDGLKDTYDFILLEQTGDEDHPEIYETGCRFKIEECKPCCK